MEAPKTYTTGSKTKAEKEARNRAAYANGYHDGREGLPWGTNNVDPYSVAAYRDGLAVGKSTRRMYR